MVNCPNCGKQIAIEDASFCPYCGKPLKALQKHTPFPITAGVLTIIASCIAITMGLLYIVASFLTYGFAFLSYDFGWRFYFYEFGWSLNVFYLIVGVLGIVAFAFGLIGGIFALKRRRIAFSIFGISLLIASGVMMAIPLWVYGLPIVVLSILSIVFVAIFKDEFT